MACAKPRSPPHRSSASCLGKSEPGAAQALVDGVTVSAHLSAVLYKQLLRVPIVVEDVQAVDSEVHNSMQWMLENSVTGCAQHGIGACGATSLMALWAVHSACLMAYCSVCDMPDWGVP